MKPPRADTEPRTTNNISRELRPTRQPDERSRLMEELVHDAIDVQDCAVVGLQDHNGITHPVLFVVPRNSDRTSADDIHKMVGLRIDSAGDPNTAYPAAVIVLKDIKSMPRGVTGKILKRSLRDDFYSCLAKRDAPLNMGVVDEYYA